MYRFIPGFFYRANFLVVIVSEWKEMTWAVPHHASFLPQTGGAGDWKAGVTGGGGEMERLFREEEKRSGGLLSHADK